MSTAKGPTIHRIIGQLPPRWDRSVIFFANLRSLFFGNDAQCDWLCTEIKGIGTYGGRLVPLLDLMFAGKNNVLVVEEAPNSFLLTYYEERLGLELPEVRVLSWEEYRTLADGGHAAAYRDHPAGWVDGYVTDPYLESLAQALGKRSLTHHEGSITGNNKLKLHRFLESAGLPVFTTYTAPERAAIPGRLAQLGAQGFTHAAIKSQIGASGIGLVKVPCIGAELDDLPDSMFYEGEVMVQGWLDASLPEIEAVGSPSVQLFVQDDAVYLYDLTEQLLSEDHLHQGNIAPPPYLADKPELQEELLRQAELMASWLHGTGYRGTASVDYIVIRRAGAVEAYACEINARVTGATYPSMLARHFAPGEAWLMRNLRSHQPVRGEDILYVLEKAGLLYLPGKERGVLPINFNLNEQGLEFKGQFLCIAPDTDACYTLLKEADDLETAEWIHARD